MTDLHLRAPDEEPAPPAIRAHGAADDLAQATAAWLAAKKPTTRDAYRRDLDSWATFCTRTGRHPLLARKPDADLYGAHLQDPAGPRLTATSAARRMAAVSSWYRYLIACDLHDRNPFAAAERPRVDRDHTATAFLDERSARRLLAAAEARPGLTGLRDTAMVRLMLQLGVRVTEVCALTPAALGTTGGQRTVTIRGKGGKRVVRALPPAAAEAVDRYLAARDEARDRARDQGDDPARDSTPGQADDPARDRADDQTADRPHDQARHDASAAAGPASIHGQSDAVSARARPAAPPAPRDPDTPAAAPPPLFTTHAGRPVDRTYVFRLVRALAREADLPHPDTITPHSLRHTFATLATDRGADLDDLQDAMGHADPRTTRRYQRSARRLDRDPAHLVAAALG